MEHPKATRIPLEECKHGFLYKLHSRNLKFGVYNEENKGFIGIREKFGYRYLDTEYHWDTGTGTAHPKEELEKLPEDILVKESLGTVDKNNGRPVSFAQGGKGWCYADTGESDQSISPVSLSNNALFKFLEKFDPIPFSTEDLERMALDDFAVHNGRVLLANVIHGFKETDSHEWVMNPPVRVRVIKTSRDSIIHWNDPDFLDPYWDVEVLEEREELKEGRGFWVDGISRNQRGNVETPNWTEEIPKH